MVPCMFFNAKFCIAIKADDACIAHLQMWIDDLRIQIEAVRKYGNDLEKGNVFNIVKQKMFLECELKKRKDNK